MFSLRSLEKTVSQIEPQTDAVQQATDQREQAKSVAKASTVLGDGGDLISETNTMPQNSGRDT